MSTISGLANCARLMAFTTFSSFCGVFCHQGTFITPGAKRCLHSYQHLHCYYSATVVTLSVLELVQLADMLGFVVVC